MEIFPAQLPEKLPDIEFDVALVTCHWKLPQEPGEGTANVSESHVPVVGVGVVAVTVGAVGERTVVLLSTAHAVAKVEAAARAASSTKIFFMLVRLDLHRCRRAHEIVRADTPKFENSARFGV
jgi:hypothetical protein